MKARVVLATDSLEPSGMGEHMLTLGAALNHQFDIVLAAPEGEPGAALLGKAARQGLRIKVLELGDPAGVPLWLREHAPDLVHVHAGIGWEGHDLVRAASAVGVPVVRTEHLPYLLTDVVQQAEYRAMLFSVDQRIAVSQAVAQSHAGKGRGPIAVVPNGVVPPVPQSDRGVVRRGLGIGDSDRLLLTVARLTAQKGHDVLLDAVARLRETRPELRVVLVGDGPERDVIETALRERALGAQVQLLGRRDDVADLLVAADLFVLPSHFEGLSLALLEAMAVRLPVVATATGSNIEALGAEHPYLVAPGDAEALAEAIGKALGDPPGAARAVEAAGARYAARFTAERMADQTAQIYQTILSNGRGAAA